jgi:hypothetical protein
MAEQSMKSGVCPKCDSDNVHLGEKLIGGNILLGGVIRRAMKRDFYVCTTCGYVESHMSDSKDLGKIANKWPRADDVKRKNDELRANENEIQDDDYFE